MYKKSFDQVMMNSASCDLIKCQAHIEVFGSVKRYRFVTAFQKPYTTDASLEPKFYGWNIETQQASIKIAYGKLSIKENSAENINDIGHNDLNGIGAEWRYDIWIAFGRD